MEDTKSNEELKTGLFVLEIIDSKSENDLPIRQRSFTFNSCEGEEIVI
jgi:hypothetical protein